MVGVERRRKAIGYSWLVVALGVLVLWAVPSHAIAAPVQEFNFRLENFKGYGAYTAVFSSRTYDTTGAVPPPLVDNFLHLPAGIKIRRQILRRKRFRCDVRKLRITRSPRSCRSSRLGKGRVLIDARPFLAEPIPARIYIHLGKRTTRGAVASLVILGIPDPHAAVVRQNPVVRDTRVVVQSNFFRDRLSDPRFDYKLVLPTGPIGGINISVAEVKATIKGLTLRKRSGRCLRHHHGRCVKRSVRTRKVFWATRPKCGPTRRVAFQAVYDYSSLPTITRTIELSCSHYRR
jgi:hypothetical protein